MKEKIQEAALAGAMIAVFSVLFVVAFFKGTSAESWHAGQHVASCDGSANCGCYEKLMSLDGE